MSSIAVSQGTSRGVYVMVIKPVPSRSRLIPTSTHLDHTQPSFTTLQIGYLDLARKCQNSSITIKYLHRCLLVCHMCNIL